VIQFSKPAGGYFINKVIYERSKKMVALSKQFWGYALGTGNSVPAYVPDSNYFALIQAVLDGR